MSDENDLPTDEEIYQNAIARLDEKIQYESPKYSMTIDGQVVAEPIPIWIMEVTNHVMKVLNNNRNRYASGTYKQLPGYLMCRRRWCGQCNTERNKAIEISS